jgi:uncharacterized peroxidase-related enzyme
VPRWSPYVTPVVLDARRRRGSSTRMQVTPSNKKISAYVLTLAHDPESLKVRSPLFNAIMYGKGGLSSAQRELGATAASIVNRCVYCAAVHASRFNQLTKRTDVIAEIFANGLDAELEEHQQAIFDFAVEAVEDAVRGECRRHRRPCATSACRSSRSSTSSCRPRSSAGPTG